MNSKRQINSQERTERGQREEGAAETAKSQSRPSLRSL